MTGFIVFEDGPSFGGQWLGGREAAGEVVFNTSHSGYEEISTDPSYYGQILVMTAPQQGNYGIHSSHRESRQMWFSGFVCLEMYKSRGNERTWASELASHKIATVDGLDTRMLVEYLRDNGTQVGAIVEAESESIAREKASGLIQEFKKKPANWAASVSRSENQSYLGENPLGPKIALVDYGCKENILRHLVRRSSEVQVFSSQVSAEELLSYSPGGIMLSNGPGDPENVEGAVKVISQVLGKQVIFGICLGHQLLSMALGAKTYPLKFGHHGANHPVKNLETGKVYITSQNHGYAVKAESFPNGVKVTHQNLNDNTVSGIEDRSQKCFSLQFHPENSPGPRDAEVYFDQFIKWIEDGL